MTQDEIKTKLRALLEPILGAPLMPDNDADCLHMDSMAMLELIVGIEKVFTVSVDEDAMDEPENFESVDAITRLITQHS